MVSAETGCSETANPVAKDVTTKPRRDQLERGHMALNSEMNVSMGSLPPVFFREATIDERRAGAVRRLALFLTGAPHLAGRARVAAGSLHAFRQRAFWPSCRD